MACSHPFLFIPKTLQGEYIVFSDPSKNYFPCGWCLNCRVDKRNSLQHRCERELIDKKCGAFVTFTYDDPHLIKNLKYNIHGELVASLSKSDAKHFLDRINKAVHALPDCLLCNHNYKYLIVGEYGQNGQVFDRPHFHVLFFGLDFAFCKKLFERCWKQGNIYVGSIGPGAIPYCLKYLDKQILGDLAKIKYDQNNLERPFQHHSIGLGSQLYREQLQYAKSHNACYRWKGKDVPYPIYYKNKYLVSSNYDYKIKAQKIFDSSGKKIDVHGLKKYPTYFSNLKDAQKYLVKHFQGSYYDLHEASLDLARRRERNINISFRNHGEPMLDYDKLLSEVLSYKHGFKITYSSNPTPDYVIRSIVDDVISYA